MVQRRNNGTLISTLYITRAFKRRKKKEYSYKSLRPYKKEREYNDELIFLKKTGKYVVCSGIFCNFAALNQSSFKKKEKNYGRKEVQDKR